MSTYPSQEHFNIEHSEPREYGEGDYCLVGAQYTKEEATKRISVFITMLTGEPASDYYDMDEVYKVYVGTGVNEDGEPDYVVASTGGEPYEAWAVAQ